MNDKCNVTTAASGKFPKCSNDMVLHSKPGDNYTYTILLKNEHDKINCNCVSIVLLVYCKVFLSHHELQVVNDDMVDVVKVNSMLHRVKNSPIGSKYAVT